MCRFEEIDLLGVVWHGRYASYFEDARFALGEKYGIGYETVRAYGFVTPVKLFHVDYVRPLLFNQKCVITAAMHRWLRAFSGIILMCLLWTMAARICREPIRSSPRTAPWLPGERKTRRFPWRFSRRSIPCAGLTRPIYAIRKTAGDAPKRIRPYMEQFAFRMEDAVKKEPYQFFNFYDMRERTR